MTQPTTFYRTHHEVAAPQVDAKAFRQGWRVISQLDALLAAQAIARSVWQAGDDFRRDYERAFGKGLGGSGSAGSGGGHMRHADGFAIGRLNAVRRVRHATRALGEPWITLVERCVVQDASWQATGRALGCSDKTARDRTVEALKRLAKVSLLR